MALRDESTTPTPAPDWAAVDWDTLSAATTFAEAAPLYIAAGIPVFPVKLDKKPLTEHGFLDATTDPLQIAYWGNRYPAAGVGIPTGEASSTLLVDIDPRHGGDYDRLAAHFDLPATLSAETGGGGQHLLFAHPGFPVPNGAGATGRLGKEMGDGYDTRGDGGYFVAAPSRHPSGARYRWLLTCRPVGAPEPLLALLRPADRPHAAPRTDRPGKPHTPTGDERRDAGRYWLNRYLPDAREGNRNNACFLLCLQLRDEMLSQDEARTYVLDYAASVPGGDFDEREALATLRSVYSRPPRQRAQSLRARTSPRTGQGNRQTGQQNGGPSGDGETGDAGDGSGGYQRPQIVTTGRQLRDVGADALAALVAANNPAVLFRRNARLARVRPDEHGRTIIEEVTDEMLRARLADVADFGRWVKNPNPTGEDDEMLFKAVPPPIDLVSYIAVQTDWPFPTLISVTEAPVLRPDGSIVTEPGYDAATMLYYAPDPGLKLAPIPTTPTIADVMTAKETLDDVLGDFPYDCPTSRAHAYALLLTAVVRPAIAGMVPLALLTAPVAGTGKTLLASLVPAIASGRDPAMMAAPDKEEEWVKIITSMLLAGPSFALIDNISGTLKSSSLEMLLTSPVWQQRMLGANRMVSLQQRAVWVATGNNIQLAGDLPRRCYRIRLDAKMARPERRATFKHRDIVRYARKQRGKLLAALLTLARSWYADSCPSYAVTPMGSYEDWARIVGSILAHAGIDGFLANLDEMYAEADTEGPQWASFFAAWRETYGGNAITTNVLARDASNPQHAMNVALPETLAPAAINTGALTKRLGYELRKHVDVRYDLGDGNEVYLTRAGTQGHDKVVLWRVIFAEYHPHASGQTDSSPAPRVRVMAGDIPNSTREKRENSNTYDTPIGSYENHPQSPASPAKESPAQADSSVTPAGDEKVSPAYPASPAPDACYACGGTLKDYGDGLRCQRCDASQPDAIPHPAQNGGR